MELDPYDGWEISEFPIPQSFDDEDVVLELFLDDNLDNPALEIEPFTLADWFRLPGALWRLALHATARQTLELATARSSPLSSCVAQIHDEVLRDEPMLWSIVRRGLVDHLADDALFASFRSIIYETQPMRDRLTELRVRSS